MKNERLQFEHMDELLFLYLKGLANDAERTAALRWINEKPEHRKYFDTLKELFIVTGNAGGIKKYNKTEGWKRVEAGYYKEIYKKGIVKNNSRKQSIVRIIVSLAAALVIALLSGVLVHSYMTKKYSTKDLVYNEICVPFGAKSVVTLSDGTKIWLNAGSKLRYPLQFGKSSREVSLEGEGYFDVTREKNRRFLVKTSDITIKVYGTQFNVKAYPDENKIFTTLVKGSVVIEANNDAKFVTLLKPNETAIYYKSHPKILTKDISKQNKVLYNNSAHAANVVVTPEKNTESMTSWKDSLWVIEGEDLGQLAIKLDRRYDVKIEFTNNELKNYKFTGILADETFEQVMNIIQLSAPIKFHVNHKLVTISEDKLYKITYDNMINKTN